MPHLEADLVETRAALSSAHARIAELQTELTQQQHASAEKIALLNDAQLRAVGYGWPEEALAQNAQELAALGKQLSGRIAKLAERCGNVGERLGKAVDAHNSANERSNRACSSLRGASRTYRRRRRMWRST